MLDYFFFLIILAFSIFETKLIDLSSVVQLFSILNSEFEPNRTPRIRLENRTIRNITSIYIYIYPNNMQFDTSNIFWLTLPKKTRLACFNDYTFHTNIHQNDAHLLQSNPTNTLLRCGRKLL